MKRNSLLLTQLVSFSLALSSCAPAVIGGGAAMVGTSAVQEKGLSGNITDSQIATKIKVSLYQYDPNLYHHVNVSVQNAEVLLTGSVATNEMHLEAVKRSWDTKGVTRVIDNIAVAKEGTVGLYAKDTWITTQVRTKLFFDSDIQSINYSIKTVSGVVYLMGIAQNQAELDRAINIARHVEGVTKVVSYVHMKETIED